MLLRLSSLHRWSIRVSRQARARRQQRLWALERLDGRVLLSGNPTIYTVTDTSDNASDTGSLPYAINQANNQGNAGFAPANSDGSAIAFAIPTSDPGYDASTGSWTITLSSTLELSETDGPEVIDGPGADLLAISGNTAVEVFAVDSGVTAAFMGLTITGGSAGDGGGIFVQDDSTLTVNGCTIEGNSAVDGSGIENRGTVTITGGSTIEGNTATNGGGIFNYATLTVSDSTVEGNTAYNGGGILSLSSSTTTITDSTIEDNTASGEFGGGIAMQGDGSGALTITNCTIAGNSGSVGGGVGNRGGTATITGSTFEGNTATSSSSEGGGAIWNTGTLTVADSTIDGNLSVGEGGGGGITNDSLATVIDSTVDDNSGIGGGGIANGGGGAVLTVTNSTIADNSGFYGGGFSNSGTLTAVNDTIVYNSAGLVARGPIPYGGGIDNGIFQGGSGGTLTLDNTIVAVNTLQGRPDDIDGLALSASSESNLVGVDTTQSLINGQGGNIVVDATNPGLGALAYNGGPTQTIALLAGSPAIDAGSNALADEYSLTTDQRGAGFQRIVDGVVDIGAYERAAPVSTTLVSSPNPSVYGQTITLTATVTAGGPATVYTVNSTSSGSSGTGTSGTLPYVISQANLNPNLAGSVIEFDIPTTDPGYNATAGSWTIALNPNNGPLELEAPSGPLVIDGPGAGSLTISGGGVIEVFQDDPAAPATLSGLTVSGGSAVSGGGISVQYGATLTVIGCSIVNNSAIGGGGIENAGVLTVTGGSTIADNSAPQGQGGGIENRGTVTITGGSTIEGNTATNGGGIFNYAILTVSDSTVEGNTAYNGGGILSYSSSTTTITDSTIEGNTASGEFGGGIAMQGDGSGALTITNCTIAGNSGPVGGGVGNRGGTATITGSTFEGNTATSSSSEGGGAIWNTGTLTVADSTIEGNSTVAGDPAGGGIENDFLATVTNCTIDDNTSNFGGGIFNYGGSATLTVINSTIAANSAIANGGVVVNYDGTLTAINSTIAYNSGGFNYIDGGYNGSGGVYSYNGTTTLDNTIVAANTADDGADDVAGAGLYSASSDNLVGVDEIGSLANGNNGNQVGIANPGLGSLANNGGPTQTIALLAGSPAIDAGSNALAVDPTTALPLATDQRDGGYPRIVNETVDIGAFEVQAAPVMATTITLSSPVNPSVFGQSVTFTAAVVPSTGSGAPAGTVQFLIDGRDFGGPVTLVDGSATSAAISSLSVANHTIGAVYSGGTDFAASTGTLTQTVNPASTSTGSVPPTGSVTFYLGAVNPADEIGTGTLSTNSNGVTTATVNTHSLPAGTDAITAVYGGDTNYPAGTSNVVSQTTTPAPLVITANNQTKSFGQTNPILTVSYSGFVNGDTSANLTTLPTVTTTATTSSPVGSYPITASGAVDPNYTISYVAGTLTISQSIIVLDPTAGGALSLSGNASINIPGGVFVDSSSSSAISASGNAQVKASVIDVHGGVHKSGNASFSPAPTTGAATLLDPLASLGEPSASGLTNYGSKSLSGNSSATINPGIYSQITVSGNGTLTMNSGRYIIEGGGFSVSGNASVTGSGVTIFNAGSKYPTTGGTYGSITVSGNGSCNLSPPTTGVYAGIVVFQPRDNTKALSLSGNASGMTGTVYAPTAQLAESGNSQLNAAIVVDTLTVSGNGIANTLSLDAPTGTVAYTPAQVRDAYGINSLSWDGTGQTIAIVDAYDDPSIFQALDAFDAQFTLTDSGPTLYNQYGPASSFLSVLNQYGQATSLPTTDPNGPGADNWEVEESLDVEWAHAMAPGAQIILVEANSQAFSDLMASVTTAASQPSVSVVSMSWGFPEGQAVFASDEATYDSVFTTPSVTFVASTGDYGAADPEYPAYSPNVVAVGGTSLTLNADNSYNSETGWGYYSDSVGAFIGSGGGTSLYEPEPVYQQGVQTTGSRTTPDVSLVGDPATGAWIADTYNLDPSNPFEIVGGTSLSAPAWAGLLALVNQGRAAAGESTLNSSTSTDTQQALYMLPLSDYNAIANGNNGYSAGAGYNLVTGLGTPVANLLVPDLIAYQGSGTTYSGPTVGPMQNATLTNTGMDSSGPIDVFSVFDSFTVAIDGLGSPSDTIRVPGVANPTAATQDHGIAIAPDGVDPGKAADYHPVTSPVITPVATGSGGGGGMTPLDTMGARDALLTDWSFSASATRKLAPIRGATLRGPSIRVGALPGPALVRRPVLDVASVEVLFGDPQAAGSLLNDEGSFRPAKKYKV